MTTCNEDVPRLTLSHSQSDCEAAAADLGVHDILALRLANEILSRPDSDDVVSLCKVWCLSALSLLQLDTCSETTLKSLTTLVNEIKHVVDDTASIRHLDKVVDAFNSFVLKNLISSLPYALCNVISLDP